MNLNKALEWTRERRLATVSPNPFHRSLTEESLVCLGLQRPFPSQIIFHRVICARMLYVFLTTRFDVKLISTTDPFQHLPMIVLSMFGTQTQADPKGRCVMRRTTTFLVAYHPYYNAASNNLKHRSKVYLSKSNERQSRVAPSFCHHVSYSSVARLWTSSGRFSRVRRPEQIIRYPICHRFAPFLQRIMSHPRHVVYWSTTTTVLTVNI
jgi:hypothetical protein